MTLTKNPRAGVARKVSAREEALLVAIACSNAPAGRSRWTLELLADELVMRTEHEAVLRETVRRRLAEQRLKPWQKKMWCIEAGPCCTALSVIDQTGAVLVYAMQ